MWVILGASAAIIFGSFLLLKLVAPSATSLPEGD